MKNRYLFRTAAVLLAVSLLTGCRVINTAAGTPETDKGNASFGAVNGAEAEKNGAGEDTAAVSRQVGSPCANDRNAYVQARFGDALFQMDRAEEKVLNGDRIRRVGYK